MHVLIQSVGQGQYCVWRRPTPWRVAWRAFVGFLRGAADFSFYYETDPAHEFYAPGIEQMTWRLWWCWVLESWLYGFAWRFWRWQWNGAGDIIKEA